MSVISAAPLLIDDPPSAHTRRARLASGTAVRMAHRPAAGRGDSLGRRQEPTSTLVTKRSAWASVSWWPVTTARKTRRSMARSTRSVVGDDGRLPRDVAQERDLAEAAAALLERGEVVGDDDLGPARLDHVEEVAGVALLEHDLAGRDLDHRARCAPAARSIARGAGRTARRTGSARGPPARARSCRSGGAERWPGGRAPRRWRR